MQNQVTLLHWAAEKGLTTMVQLLIAGGADKNANDMASGTQMVAEGL